MPGAVFDPASARRIARVVREVERGGAPPVNPGRRGVPPGSPRRLGQTTVEHGAEETHPVQLYHGDEKGDEESLGEEQRVDAYNRFGPLAEGTWVYVDIIDGGWEIVALPVIVLTEVKDEFLAEGGSAECYLLNGDGSRKDPEEIVTVETLTENGGSVYAGVAFRGDVVWAEKYETDEEPRYVARGVGRWYVAAEAAAAGTEGGASSATVTIGEDEITIPIGYCLTDFETGDTLACWWSRPNEWHAAKLGAIQFGCGLQVNDDEESEDFGKLEVDVEQLAGCGLEVDDEGECPALKVDASALAGPGLAAVPDSCALTVQLTGGCGIVLIDGAIALDFPTIAGDGLEEEECGLKVKEDCAIQVSPDGVAVDAGALAGAGLTTEVSGGCQQLTIDVDCGLVLLAGGLGIDNSAVAGTGLVPEGECAVAVDEEWLDGKIQQWIETHIEWICEECANIKTCEDCEGLPVYRWTDGAWVLKNVCDCEDVPTPPVGAGSEGDYECGTCEPCDCPLEIVEITTTGVTNAGGCMACATFNDTFVMGRTPGCEFSSAEFEACGETWRWTMEPGEVGYTLYLERLDGAEWVVEAIFTGTGCEGDFGLSSTSAFLDALCDFTGVVVQTDPLTCEDCAGEPVYVWDGEQWELEDECDCDEEDAVEPVGDGAFIGDRECGTCDAGLVCGCENNVNRVVNATFSDNTCAGACMNFGGGSGNPLVGVGGCVWESQSAMNGCGLSVKWRLTHVSGTAPFQNWKIELINQSGGGVIVTFLFTGTFDCSSSGNNGFFYDSDNGNTECNWATGTVTVTTPA